MFEYVLCSKGLAVSLTADISKTIYFYKNETQCLANLIKQIASLSLNIISLLTETKTQMPKSSTPALPPRNAILCISQSSILSAFICPLKFSSQRTVLLYVFESLTLMVSINGEIRGPIRVSTWHLHRRYAYN